MLTQQEYMQVKLHCVTIEYLAPMDHFLRKLAAYIDFSFIYDVVRKLYCDNNGRPGIDPVVLVKYLLVGFLYGIESERRIEQEIRVNMAYRWFLGLDIGDRIPDHSTIKATAAQEIQWRGLVQRTVCPCAEAMRRSWTGRRKAASDR